MSEYPQIEAQLRLQREMAQRALQQNVASEWPIETQMRWMREDHAEAISKLKREKRTLIKALLVAMIGGSITWVALISKGACQ